ncbi:uncharacterized protein LOC142630725 [Castanea sativa]|uniref:uncharacterized protein LOC142630725 n=1 Tax=Castanea sativa TaxID=21020 RepID=UPI003F6496D6
MVWMKWNKLCSPKAKGDMGFRDLKAFNLALLAKQGWRLQHESNSLFYHVFKSKYFPDTSFIGNGKKVCIWKDKWTPFPSTYRVVSPRILLPEDATVDTLIDFDHRLWRADLVRSVWDSCNLLVDCHWNFADVVWRIGCDVGSSTTCLAQFMAIAWNIWRNRNGIRHGEQPKKKENMILKASSWLPPQPGVYKVNVDEAVFKNLSSAGMGVLIRDYKGQVVAALSQRVFAPLGSLEVEAKAMEAAVIFARDVGIQNIIFEGDSLQVYNCLHGSSKAPPAVANVLNGILFHLQSFCSFDFSHIRREGNKPAHILAQHAKFVDDFVAWVEETPSFLETVIASNLPDSI